MAEIGVKRLPAGDDEEHRAKSHQPDMPVLVQKSDGVCRVYCRKHARVIVNVQESRERNGAKPGHHHRSKEACDLRRSPALSCEQADQNTDGHRNHRVIECRRSEFQTFHRGEDRYCRRNDRVA
jgi:hypothetical protein